MVCTKASIYMRLDRCDCEVNRPGRMCSHEPVFPNLSDVDCKGSSPLVLQQVNCIEMIVFLLNSRLLVVIVNAVVC